MNFAEPPPEFVALLDARMAEHGLDAAMGGPPDPTCQGILQMGESEAIAWSFAAMKAAGVDLDTYWAPIADNFGGTAPEILIMLEARAHLGVNGLQAAGMSTVRAFPAMLRWLQL